MPRSTLLLDLDPLSDTTVYPGASRLSLEADFDVIERGDESRDAFCDAHLARTRYTVGRAPLTLPDLERCDELRAVFNTLGRFRTDVAYAECERLGIRLLTPGPVLARRVGELALGIHEDATLMDKEYEPRNCDRVEPALIAGFDLHLESRRASHARDGTPTP